MSCFACITLNELLSWIDIELSVQFMIGDGVRVGVLEYFDELSHLKKINGKSS
jgi:hypothetical protein